jgi:hypothetical protein
MSIKTFAAAAAVTLLAGAPALAAQKAPAQSGPKQPIPYSQLDAYAKASPKLKASKDWWAGSSQAQTGMSTDAAASAPATTSDPAATMPSSTMPSSTSSGDTAVNPAPSAAPPSLPSTPPTDTDPARAADPMPMTPSATPTVPPTTPK